MRIQDRAVRRQAEFIRASLDRVEPEGDELDGRERCGCALFLRSASLIRTRSRMFALAKAKRCSLVRDL
eukprot:1264937-Prymnesium_polylepis.1